MEGMDVEGRASGHGAPTSVVGVTGIAQGALVEPVYTRGGGPLGQIQCLEPGSCRQSQSLASHGATASVRTGMRPGA